jgi:hypothetical protein
MEQGICVTALSSRRASIALLAGSLLDLSVVTSTWRRNPLSSETGPRALAPFREHRCEACKGSGKGRDRFRREVVCAACDGAGRLAFDAYTGERVGTAETPTVLRFRSALCDRCGGTGVWKGARCETCEGDGRREWSPFELHLPGEDERVGADEGGLLARPRHLAVLYAAGSYAELERGLTELRAEAPSRHRLWWWRYGRGDELPLAGWERFELELAWVSIEQRMPARVRVPPAIREGQRHYEAWLATRKNGSTDAKAVQVRDDRMLRMREAGTSLEELAAAFKLTRSAVYDALDRARRRGEAA